MDKDHYNTLELISILKSRNHGHSQIFQYFFLLFVGLISLKIIFLYANKRNNLIQFSLIFLLVLSIQIFNSYLMYLLDNFNSFILLYFYLINFILLISAFFIANKILK